MACFLTSPRKLAISNTWHDFPPVEWALGPARQLLVPTDVGVPLSAPLFISYHTSTCGGSQMLQWVGLFNCLPHLAAWVVFSGTLEARLQEKSLRSA